MTGNKLKTVELFFLRYYGSGLWGVFTGDNSLSWVKGNYIPGTFWLLWASKNVGQLFYCSVVGWPIKAEISRRVASKVVVSLVELLDSSQN